MVAPRKPAAKMAAKEIMLNAEQFDTYCRLPEHLFLTAYGMQRKETVLKALVTKKLARMTRGDGQLMFQKAPLPAGVKVRCKEAEQQDAEIQAWMAANPAPPPAKQKPAHKAAAKKAEPVKKPAAKPAPKKEIKNAPRQAAARRK